MITEFKTIKGNKRSHMVKEFAKMGLNKGAEIGVRAGVFSEVMCQVNPKLKLYSIDPFDLVYGDYRSHSVGKEQQNRYYITAKAKLEPYNCEVIRKESIDAIRDFPYDSLDFVYIDGGHELDCVMVDLIEWGKRVRKGGIISGHDYYKFRIGNVVDAVNVYTYAHKVPIVYLTDERTPSWWFEKTW